MEKLRAFVIEDSPVVREGLIDALEQDASKSWALQRKSAPRSRG